MARQSSPPTLFGIRHHGPGSAQSLRRALLDLQPDVLLVEGPPDAQELIPWIADSAMEPPVALLIYRPDRLGQAVYYPFARFSPEWQALRYALDSGIEARFMDLPQAHQFALADQGAAGEQDGPALAAAGEADRSAPALSADPLHWVAQAAGYSDGERWWEHQVEQRRDSADLFAAIVELMAALRADLTGTPVGNAESAAAKGLPFEPEREATMRQAIRKAQREGFSRIAVVCGAWHVPALQELDSAGEDTALLRGLPKVKTAATWVPWTYGRLSWRSGYGAGVESPGWYDHLWGAGEQGLSPAQITTTWLAQAARLLREKEMSISPGHVIEAVRLAQALAALRQRPLPGLPELTEAVQAVFCFGESLPLQLVHDSLIVGERLGAVPADVPTVPLQADLTAAQKRLRLPPSTAHRDLELDLRKPTDLARSHLLHRLALLDIPWGKESRIRGARGTFREAWRLQWQPELSLAVIEASLWGNTVAAAAAARATRLAAEAETLAALTGLVGRLLLADLPEALDQVLDRLQAAAAAASAVEGLMEALPPLARTLRYGDVRSTDAAMLAEVVSGLVARICVGLAPACALLDEEAAAVMVKHIAAVNSALALLQDAEHQAAWQQALARLADQAGLHGLLAGRICRILMERGEFDAAETARRMGLALSPALDPKTAAAWIEGFLLESGSLLIHDPALWQILDSWVMALPGEQFTQHLPLLRRTFATFTGPERRQLQNRVKSGRAPLLAAAGGRPFDPARADAVLPVLAQLLGLEKEQAHGG